MSILRAILAVIGISLAAVASLRAAKPQSVDSVQSPASQHRAVLDRYCVVCHNERVKTAGLMLDKMDLQNVPAGAEVWEKVIRKLRTGLMPPVGVPRPDQATYNSLATYLETSIDRSAAAMPEPGTSPAIHRLNRVEYSNVIRDLLALEIDAASLLPHDSGGGFDNNADVLSVTPLLMERYMSAAQRISRLAIGDTTIRPDSKLIVIPQALLQNERMSGDQPFGSRGGTAFHYRFPLDGEYVVKINLRKNDSPLYSGSVVGLSEPHQLEVRVDGVRVKRLTVGGSQMAQVQGTGEKINPHLEKGDDFEVRFPAQAGTRVVGIAFVNELYEPEGESEVIVRPPIPQLNNFWRFQDGAPSVETVMIGGPYDVSGPGDTASRHKILVCKPAGPKDEDACARKILANLARHAYRRPVTDADVQNLFPLYVSGRRQGFEAGIRMALRGVLVSREFLFRTESALTGVAHTTPYRIGDMELASRLSFFLWSSIPDDTLLDLAARGQLKDPAVLEQQVRRMMGDPRSKAAIENFFGQWLQLRNLDSVQPDVATFPDFDENLREAFRRETDMFLESMVREDHSVAELLNANYTFANERLARHYGIPNISGEEFRRVNLSNENRWGLLGKGAILTLTSYPNRTSPVLRGKFVLENIMGSPPPPPPPDVPALKENGPEGKLTVRQLMEQHRANPACAICHTRMDPLGFALDNFDGIGQWRTTEANVPIDSSGVLPDGTKFNGIVELRKILMSHPEQFVLTVTENLLTYALGRGLEYYDEPAVRKIVREAAPNNYRWSSIVLGIVKSVPFQMREPVTAAGIH